MWDRPEPYFGGISGFEIAPDGSSYVAIGDNGQILQGAVERTDGRISGLTSRWIDGLRTTRGARVGSHFSDAEGLAIGLDGQIFVSFEQIARVWSYAAWDAAARPLPSHPAFAHLQDNKGLEALAIGPDGALFAIPEMPPLGDRDLPVFRYDGAAWAIASRLPASSFLPTGADFGPDGRLYVLWREWSLPLRFASRVTRHAVGASGLSDGEIVLETATGAYDNLEAISLWRTHAGGMRMVLVSDDNNSVFQRTEVVEFALGD